MSASSDGSAERLQGIGLHPHYLNPGDDHMGLVWRSPEDPNIVVVLDEPGPDGGYIDYNSSQGVLETFELKNGNYLAVYPSYSTNEWGGINYHILGKVFDPKPEILRRSQFNCAYDHMAMGFDSVVRSGFLCDWRK